MAWTGKQQHSASWHVKAPGHPQNTSARLASELQKRTARKGQPGQNFQDRDSSIGLPAQNCKDKIARAEQKGEDSQKRTGMQGS
jgi:hypothetical protein